MRRKTRDIVVRDLKFGYVISEEDATFPGQLRVKVWSTETKSGQKLELRVRFDDLWLNMKELTATRDIKIEKSEFEFRPVTPSEVRKMIEWCLGFGWTPSYDGKPLKLDWCRQRLCGFDPSRTTKGEQVDADQPTAAVDSKS